MTRVGVRGSGGRAASCSASAEVLDSWHRSHLSYECRGWLTLLFGTRISVSIRMLQPLEPFSPELTPAVPYVYLRPSGAGCFCAASAMGSDMMCVVYLSEGYKKQDVTE